MKTKLDLPTSLQVTIGKTKFLDVKGTVGLSGILPYKSIVSQKNLMISTQQGELQAVDINKIGQEYEQIFGFSTFSADELVLSGTLQGDIEMEFSDQYSL